MDDVCKHSFALDTDGYPGMRCDKSREYALSLSLCSVTFRDPRRAAFHTIPQPTRLVSHVLQTTCARPEWKLGWKQHFRANRLRVAKVAV